MSNSVNSSLALQYLDNEAFISLLETCRESILGAIAFGKQPETITRDVLTGWVDIPCLAQDTFWEVCVSEKPIIRSTIENMSISKNDDFLFGLIQIDEQNAIENISYEAYSHLFNVIDNEGYPHLLRIWNYFPHINEHQNGLERYRSFSIGRHEAFENKGRDIQMENIPAACALGSKSGSFTVYFLASKRPGIPVENPRQMSAYHYPAQYGPRSPTFSRALMIETKAGMPLFISGTASIVGHDTLHIGDPLSQAKETLNNIDAVVNHASLSGWIPSQAKPQIMLKVYLRDAEYLSAVKEQITLLGPSVKAFYLQADICRADLLLEIEGVYL